MTRRRAAVRGSVDPSVDPSVGWEFGTEFGTEFGRYGNRDGRAVLPRARSYVRPCGGGEEDTWARC